MSVLVSLCPPICMIWSTADACVSVVGSAARHERFIGDLSRGKVGSRREASESYFGSCVLVFPKDFSSATYAGTRNIRDV